MASEITLKYLHPSIKTYITTDNYNFDTSVSREVLFVADVFEHGVDNKLQQVNTLSEYLFKYGEPNLDKFGQAGYNVERWLTNGNSAVIMRLLPEDASYAHAVLNIQYKNSTNGKTVLNAEGDETKINDVYLRPLVTYIGVNNTSEALLDSELSEDRSGYPTTDGYVDNFIFIAYPEGRGEYYNDLGFRIRLNPSYDGTLNSRVYTFEIIKFKGTSYDIVDGPYYVSFDPDAIDPNSQKSMYIENVINSYSDFIKIKFSDENYIKLATIINEDVDPYTIDIISGKSRILSNGETETYYSEATGKDEDVHIALRKYSTTGVALTDNGEYILNILNNDETSSDIVDIADNSRRVIYNNQKFVTEYMRSFYNWLIQDRIRINLDKVFAGNIESSLTETSGSLLKEKAYNLIYANNTNSDPYVYNYDKTEFDSLYVGTEGRNDAWYLRAQEIIQPGLKDKNKKYVGTKTNPGYEVSDTAETYTSTAQMESVITEDGFIVDNNKHLISYYNNFMKYLQFVANYDVFNDKSFVVSEAKINANDFIDIVDSSTDIEVLVNKNTSTPYYAKLAYTTTDGESQQMSIPNPKNMSYKPLTKEAMEIRGQLYSFGNYVSMFNYVFNNLCYDFVPGTSIGMADTPPYYAKDVIMPGGKKKNGIGGMYGQFSWITYGVPSTGDTNALRLIPTYIDKTTGVDVYVPITDYRTYDAEGNFDLFAEYIHTYDLLGDLQNQPFKGVALAAGVTKPISSDADESRVANLISKYLYTINPQDVVRSSIGSNGIPFKFLVFDTADENKPGTWEEFDFDGVKEPGSDTTTYGYNITHFHNLLDHITNTMLKSYNYKNFKVVTVKMSNPSEPGASTYAEQVGNFKDKLGAKVTYNEYRKHKGEYDGIDVVEFNFTNFIEMVNDYFRMASINVPSNDGLLKYPGIDKRFDFFVFPMASLNIPYVSKEENNQMEFNVKPVPELISTNVVFDKSAIKDNPDYPIFNKVFTDKLKNGKLTQCFNKVASYAALISKELDGKGKDTIAEDLANAREWTDLDYSDYSLTTIFNLLVGGFESIVNNQGSITDYSNYSSLKYLMKTVNNNLDLRSTYLTLLNVHKNNILDLSTKLAKNNASVILGDETLDNLYAAMDTVVVETNYLITNIINTVLNKTYKIQNLEELVTSDPKKSVYAYYFANKDSAEKNPELLNCQVVDPLGITVNIDKLGTADADMTQFKGILPLLEKILINITGENHYGSKRNPIYGGPSLIDIYDDIKNGYVLGGLTQERYETMYRVLSESFANLSAIHNIIIAFINEKYITEIINTLVGTLNINNAIINYKGSTYTVNTLFEYYNSGIDEDLTQSMVTNLINDALVVSENETLLPIEAQSEAPIILYPSLCIEDIKDSISLAKANKDIVKSNILKQDHVLASLNTLCYDNLTTDISSPLGFAEGSDGSFTYDNSTAAALKKRMHMINDIRIKAYKGTWNEDVLNKDLFEFDHVFDANYEDSVKNAIITLARDERQDFFFWADTKIQNTVQDCLDWKNSFTNSTYFMSVMSQSQLWYDEYTSKNIGLTSTYLIADLLGRHIGTYGRHYPMAGSRRGVVGGFISNDWYPNEEQKEKLYTSKVNYIEKDISTIRIGSQNTNYPAGPLGQINNMLVVLKIKRVVEKIAKTYQFEFNTNETRSAMAAEINNYLQTWINNGACTLATSDVYASDYDIIQKIVRVDITLQFTGVIERIVINIDCPASI